MRPRSAQDLAGGLVLVVIALIAGNAAADLPFGRAAKMGPGWFPMVLSGLIGLFGVGIALRGFIIDGPDLERWSLRRMVPVLIGIVWFAVTVRPLGMVLAGGGLIVLSSLAAPDFEWKGTVWFGAVVVALAAVLFPVLLSLPIPIWPRF